MEEPRACIAFVLRLSDKCKLEMTPVLYAKLALIRVITRKFAWIQFVTFDPFYLKFDRKIIPMPVVSCVFARTS